MQSKVPWVQFYNTKRCLLTTLRRASILCLMLSLACQIKLDVFKISTITWSLKKKICRGLRGQGELEAPSVQRFALSLLLQLYFSRNVSFCVIFYVYFSRCESFDIYSQSLTKYVLVFRKCIKFVLLYVYCLSSDFQIEIDFYFNCFVL